MSLFTLKTSLAMATCLLLCFSNAVMEQYVTSQNFVYYYDGIEASHIPVNTDMPSSELAQYAFNAYYEMMDIPKPQGIRQYTKPTMVSAMWYVVAIA